MIGSSGTDSELALVALETGAAELLVVPVALGSATTAGARVSSSPSEPNQVSINPAKNDCSSSSASGSANSTSTSSASSTTAAHSRETGSTVQRPRKKESPTMSRKTALLSRL